MWQPFFVTALDPRARKAREDLADIVRQVGRGVPLVANMVEGGKTPLLSGPELESLGFSLVIFPGGIVRTLARTAVDYYASLAAHGSTQAFRDRMFDFNQLNSLIGTPEMIERGRRLGSHEPEHDQ